MKVKNLMACVMAMANSIINKAVIMMANGKKITCMDLVNYITLIINQHIKVIGLLINFMVMVKYTMINQHQLIVVLIILISKKFNKNGNIIKAHLFVIQNKDLVNLYYQMGNIMKEIFKEIEYMVKESLLICLEKLCMGSGRIRNWLRCWIFDEFINLF